MPLIMPDEVVRSALVVATLSVLTATMVSIMTIAITMLSGTIVMMVVRTVLGLKAGRRAHHQERKQSWNSY